MKKVFLSLIHFYRRFRSTLFRTLGLPATNCRFSPTCSQYSYEAIRRYGIIRGLMLSFKRIIRCHPFSKGGCDPVR